MAEDTHADRSQAEFYDARLVAIYDAVCPIDSYEAFDLRLAAQMGATSIVDVGCGTGLLTCSLAAHGHAVIGIEPSRLMLDVAKRRAYGDHVTWMEGGAARLGPWRADLALMTGHVAQFFLEGADWQAALQAINHTLRPGGHIAFESRNPLVQPWAGGANRSHLDWPTRAAPRRVVDAVAGEVEW